MRIGFDGRAFSLEEIHRFRNLPIETPSAPMECGQLWHDMQIGIGKALSQHQIDSIGVCTWGVDFALLDRAGDLIDNPYHYRDPRSVPMMDWVYDRVPARTVYERTGIQLMSINTLFQLASLKAGEQPRPRTRRDAADHSVAVLLLALRREGRPVHPHDHYPDVQPAPEWVGYANAGRARHSASLPAGNCAAGDAPRRLFPRRPGDRHRLARHRQHHRRRPDRDRGFRLSEQRQVKLNRAGDARAGHGRMRHSTRA